MLDQILDKINALKIENSDFLNELEILESLYENLDIVNRSQVALFLARDYEFYGETDKSIKYYKKGIEDSRKILKEKILATLDRFKLYGLLSSFVVIKLKCLKTKEKCFHYINELISSDIWSLVLQNCNEVFAFLLKESEKDKTGFFFEMLLKFTVSQENIQTVFAHLLRMNFEEHLENFYNTLLALKMDVIYYQVFFESNESNIELCADVLISKKSNLQDLDIIFVNGILKEKRDVVKKILERLEYILEAHNLYILHYIFMYSKLFDFDNKVIQGFKKPPTIPVQFQNVYEKVKEDMIRYLIHQKKYSAIIKLTEDVSLKFYCYLKMKNIIQLKYHYDTFSVIKDQFKSHMKMNKLEKYTNITESESSEQIQMNQINQYTQKNIDKMDQDNKTKCSSPFELKLIHFLKYFILVRENPKIFDILESTTSPETYVKYLLKIHKYGESNILLSACNLGISVFTNYNTQLMKVFVSYIHLEDLDFSIEERSKALLKILDNWSKSEKIDEKTQDWIFSVCYNNALDLLGLKNEFFWNIIQYISQLNFSKYFNQIIEILLIAVKEKILNKTSFNSDTFLFFKKYIELQKIDKDILILFYEVDQEIEVIPILKPLSELKDNQIIRLISASNHNIEFKIDLFKEGQKRNILTEDIILRIFEYISILGPLPLYNFISRLEMSFLQIPKVRALIEYQIEFLTIIKHYSLESKFRNLLKN